MKKITVDEMKSIELNILIDIAAFCEEHGLRYYLCGGTLLGAIRHQGFIPWDDDIDIIMPRPDYMKFLTDYNKKKSPYRVNSEISHKDWYTTYANVEDMRTIKINANFGNFNQYGIDVDLFPIDGSPDNEKKRKRFWMINNILTRIATLSALSFTISKYYADQDVSFSTVRTIVRTGIKFLGIPIAKLICTFFNLNHIVTNRAMKYDVDKSEYIGVSTFPHYGYKECVKGAPFLKVKKRIFEGIYFNTPDNYDEYLSNLYGDYMKLPPKDKQVSHHDFNAYWREEIS